MFESKPLAEPDTSFFTVSMGSKPFEISLLRETARSRRRDSWPLECRVWKQAETTAKVPTSNSLSLMSLKCRSSGWFSRMENPWAETCCPHALAELDDQVRASRNPKNQLTGKSRCERHTKRHQRCAGCRRRAFRKIVLPHVHEELADQVGAHEKVLREVDGQTEKRLNEKRTSGLAKIKKLNFDQNL